LHKNHSIAADSLLQVNKSNCNYTDSCIYLFR